MKKVSVIFAIIPLFFLLSCAEDEDEIAIGNPCSVEGEEACSVDGSEILACWNELWQTKKKCNINYGEYCHETTDGELGCKDKVSTPDTGDTSDTDTSDTSDTSDTGDNSDSDNNDTVPPQPDNDTDTTDSGVTDNDTTVIDDDDSTEPYNDVDTAEPDEDSDIPQPADEDADIPQEDADDDTDTPDEDIITANPCDPNPCADKTNSTEVCTVDGENYTCGCIDGYEWKSDSCKQTNETICIGLGNGAQWTGTACVKENVPCPSINIVHSDNAEWNISGVYAQEYDFVTGQWNVLEASSHSEEADICSFKCADGYYWHDSDCVNGCTNDPCSEIANADEEHTCNAIDATTFSCGCATNYFWHDNNCVNPCEPENNPDNNPCADKENTDEAHTCTPKNATEYKCTCMNENYFWDGKNCRLPMPLGNICTGQTECYNSNGTSSTIIECPVSSSGTCAATNNCDYNYFGQDTQYNDLCEEHDFVVKTASNGEKTLFDNNTGLEWQNLQRGVTYANAKNACSDGWRLPTPQELLTLVDSSRYSPPFDFSSIWTDMTQMNNSLFGVQRSGSNYYTMDLYGQISFTSSGTFNVMCVRGNTLPGGSFSTTDDTDVVTDSTTGLMWQKTPSDAMNWRMALAYCETSEDSGYTDWRLPTKNELASLLEHKDKTAAPYSNFPFKTSKISLWTSTTSVGNKANANYVSTEYKTGTAAKNNNSTYRALCVRNAE